MTVCDLADRAAGLTETISESRYTFVGSAEMVQKRHSHYVPHPGTSGKREMCPTGGLGYNKISGQTADVLPNNIASYRKSANYTQDGLAKAIGTTRSMLVKLERGERPLTGEWLERIGEAVNVAPHLLIAPPDIIPNEEQLERILIAAQQSLPVGLPFAEWPRAVASELHMRLRTLAGDRASDGSQAN